MTVPIAAASISISGSGIMSAAKRFGRYKPEEEMARAAPALLKKPAMERLARIWGEYEARNSWFSAGFLKHRAAEAAEELLGDAKFSAKEIADFAACLGAIRYDETRFPVSAAVFLTALMSGSGDRRFIIPVAHLPKMDHLGESDSSLSIIVNGCVGDYVGAHMGESAIMVRGHAGDYAGYAMGDRFRMMDAEDIEYDIRDTLKEPSLLYIRGNAGDFAGANMRMGTLIIDGNAGNHVGSGMSDGKIVVEGNASSVGSEKPGFPNEGGEIHVNGEIGEIGIIAHGKVFHKGKLIVDK